MCSAGVCEELGDTYMEFGKILCLNEEALEAITIFNQAVSVYSQIFGDLHVKVADALFAEGEALVEIKSLEEGQTYFEKALVLYTELVPEGHQIGDCNNCIGFICQELDEYDEAKEYYRKALTCYLKCYGKYHHTVANVINNMATVFDDLDEHEAAAHFYEQSVAIMRRVYGPYHPQIVQSLENLSSLMESLGLTEKADELQTEADRVSEALDRGLPSIPEMDDLPHNGMVMQRLGSGDVDDDAGNGPSPSYDARLQFPSVSGGSTPLTGPNSTRSPIESLASGGGSAVSPSSTVSGEAGGRLPVISPVNKSSSALEFEDIALASSGDSSKSRTARDSDVTPADDENNNQRSCMIM
jgi:tetratricopeptide (TPR) repeat protein